MIVFSLWEQTNVSFYLRTTYRAQLSSRLIRSLNITSFSRRIFHLSSTTSNGEVFKVTVVYIYRVFRTVTRLRAGRRRNRGSIPEFCLLQSVHTGSGDHPTFYTMGTADSFPGAKAMGREVNHSLPSNTDVKSGWSYTSTPSICLHCVHRDIHLYLDTHQRWRG